MNFRPEILTKFLSLVIFFAGVPVFFLLFCLSYNPFGIREYLDMGRGLFSFNLIISTSIILSVLLISRLFFRALKDKIEYKWIHYLFWCLGELILCSLFLSLFIVLMFRGSEAFFDVLSDCLKFCFLILMYPYIIFTCLILLSYGPDLPSSSSAEETKLMRFCDENKKLKFAVSPSDVLYVASEENYVRIFYSEGGKVKDYLLRSSMKSLDPLLVSNGIVRCQRSYYVNPSHVRLLRKEKEGFVFAELDAVGVKDIPVSKTYYEEFAKFI